MNKYTGTSLRDTITPDTVSPGVTADPAGSKPSDTTADIIAGLGGNDTLNGGGGGDTISGGTGADNIDDEGFGRKPVANSGNLIHGDGGNDAIDIYVPGLVSGANPASNVVYGDDGDDFIRLGYYHSELRPKPPGGSSPVGESVAHGGEGNDFITSYVPGDSIRLDLTQASVALYGEAGNDELRATSWDPNYDGSYRGTDNADALYGGPGNDVLWVFETKDAVIERPGEGNDTVVAFEMDYTLPAYVEQLVMAYSIPDYPLKGWAGTGNAMANTIFGSSLDERLDGAGGNDTIYGDQYAQAYFPQARDTIHGGPGDDTIYGGTGNAEDSWDAGDKLYGDDGNDELFGEFGSDRLFGGAGDDKLWGQAGDDYIYGEAGSDRIGGGSGYDRIFGGAGDDVISGIGGRDDLTGGPGDDRFDYDDVLDSFAGLGNRDIIMDFAGAGKAGGDVIDLSTIDAGGGKPFVFVGTDPIDGPGQIHAGVKDAVTSQGSAVDTLIEINIAGSLAPEMEILVKNVAPGDWVAADFIL